MSEMLETLRQDPGSWTRVAYSEYLDDEGDAADKHVAVRFKVLLALQKDPRPQDEDLLRFLVEQEVLVHEKRKMLLSESLSLAAFLLVQFKRFPDIFLFARAKTANFDTYCGFDREYLFATGVEAALDYVRGSDHPQRESTLEDMLGDDGLALYDQDEIDNWWAWRSQYFEGE